MNDEYYKKENPELYRPIVQKGRTSNFTQMKSLPDTELVGNVYLVPRIKENWVYIIDERGSVQIPGGKKVKGETSIEEIINREMMEEVGGNYFKLSNSG